MRAVIQDRYAGPDALRIGEIEPPAVGDDEVLVAMRAASVHPDVWHVVAGFPLALRLFGAGWRAPRNPVPGTDVAGVVASVGRTVTRFRPGDAVFGESVRGNQWRNGGAFAELVAVPESALVHKPENVPFAEAASVATSGLIVLQNLPDNLLRAGQRALVNGAAGNVGAIALQVARARGAHVTAVDHTDKLDLLRALGADVVIDHTREDFTRGDARYDLVFDVPGNHRLRQCRRVLHPDGSYVLIHHDAYGRAGGRALGSLPRAFALMALTPVVRQLPRVVFTPPPKHELLAVLAHLLATGALTPIIDRTYPLEDASAAIRHLASGEARGRIVLVGGD